jgi:peptidoglycan hydrolase-like protein with peptidoglycan-binding domain
VRVHNDSRARQSARVLHARAFTSGNDIVFANQQYAPETPGGRSLLAHELAHTIQQQTPSTPAVQRTIGDGHDLTSPRFAGDTVLEAVYDNERLLQNGNNGAAVRKLQQALVDSGFSLPRFGVDGKFGSETEGAVRDFQRTSGLIGTDRDGIVGPTTMGWLDQRFSAGPTPAGTTHGATSGCVGIRTINVDIVSLDGSTRNPLADLEFANTVFNQCCVRFAFGGGGSEDAARTRALLGGDTDLHKTLSCPHPTADETGLHTGASADFGLSSPIRVFYVASTTPSDRGYSFPPFCATGASAGLNGMAAVTNTAASRTLAHELGHILMNSPTHPPDTNNLMHETNTATGEQLTAAQCATI